MLKLLSKREKMMLFIIAIIVLSSALYNFIFSPIFEKYSLLDSQVKIEKARLIKYKQILSRKAAIESKYNALYSKHEVINTQDPGVALLTELERLALNAGIRIIDIRPQPDNLSGGKKGMLVDLRAEGQLQGFVKYLFNIEQSFQMLSVKRLQLSAKTGVSSLEASISVFQPLNQ